MKNESPEYIVKLLMTKTNRKLALYRENIYSNDRKESNDENESPEYIVKLLMTKTNRKLALYRENKSMIEMIIW